MESTDFVSFHHLICSATLKLIIELIIIFIPTKNTHSSRKPEMT